MKLSDVSQPFVTVEPPPQRPELSAGGSGGKPEERSCIVNKGIDLNDVGDHRGSLGDLHGMDLNEGVNFVLHEGLDLNKEIMTEESSGVKKEMIDLNLDVNEEVENVSSQRRVRWFDLNVELKEDEVLNLGDREEKLGVNGRFYAAGDKQTGKELVVDENENLVNAYGGKRKVIIDLENEEESRLADCLTGVDFEEAAPVSALKNRRDRKRKEVLDNRIELAALKLIRVNAGVGNLNLKSERTVETPSEKASASVGYEGVSGSAWRERSDRKTRESSDNSITLATSETELRRSSLRAKWPSFSGQNESVNGAWICYQLSPPSVSAVSNEMITLSTSATLEESSKVQLPPSSESLDLSEVSMVNFVSVYAFLRSFSTLLFLSPFELGDFVTCVKCNGCTLLFDSIHVSLLRTLRKHLESLSSDGSRSASECLRSLNWDFVDLITWPVFVVEYLLLHSPRYIPGLDLRHFEPFQRDYYKMPASTKLEILQHLCDDVVEVEVFRSELNKRTLITECPQNMKFDSSKRKKAVADVASASCITEEHIDEPTDLNGDECCLCKMDGNLICCDGCPAAFHSRCVGVVSSLLPDGDWYCPECSFDKDNSYRVGKPIRGAELLGIDPHGRHYYSSCGYLLVLDSCTDRYSFWFYKRNDLPAVIEVLELSPFLYWEIIRAICKHWNVIYEVDRMRNDVNSRSYSMQSAVPETSLLSIRHQALSETLNQDGAFAEKRSVGKSVMTTDSSNIETETSGHVSVMLESSENGLKMENQLASSEGSAEVSQTSTKTDTLKDIMLDCSKRSNEISDDHQITRDLVNAGDKEVEEGKNLNCGIASQVSHGTEYVNFYEFAQTASAVSQELMLKSSDSSCEDATRSVEEITIRQLRIVSNRFAEFSWSNIKNLNVLSKKEKCGWCFYCKIPEDGRDCFFVMNDSIPSVENFTSEVLDIKSRENRINHLIDVICHVICIEDHLQGLLSGPWSNPYYSQLWRKSILEAADLASLKNMLLKLESNLHHRALSAEWRKHVDPVATMGSASHIVRRSIRGPLKLGISMRRGKCSKEEITRTSDAATGMSLFWWRGGRASRELFNWKVLPRSMASKAARQGGCKKILGVHYPDSGTQAKRMKYAAWRAAVETSKSVEQLALQVRELNANIRWDEIDNTNLLLKNEKESKKATRSFKNVKIHKKCNEGKVVKYLLDFGKRRPIPEVVKRHGSKLEDPLCERKKYWLEESHVPLHLLKAFEEKRIARMSNKVTCEELPETSKEKRDPLKKKGFTYLFSRAERSEKCQCVQCNKDVLIRKAVRCQNCKGFFHKKHARKSAASITAESMFTCHKCDDGKFEQVDARKGQYKLPKHKKALETQRHCSEAEEKLVVDEQPRDGEFVQTDARKGRSKLPKHKKALETLRPCSEMREKLVEHEQPQDGKFVQIYARKGQSKLAKPKKALETLRPCSETEEKLVKDEQPLYSEKKKKVPIAVSPRRSARNFDRILKLSSKNMKLKKKKRGTVNSSYWLNGLQLSRRTNDERLMHFRSKTLLVLSGEETPISNKPKCSLCGELEYTSKLNYVACEICGAWFHGDALDLRADQVQNIIGFKCHNCLKRRPIVCPHQFPTTSNKINLVAEN